MNNLIKVSSFKDLSLEKERMDYYTQYFTEYYHDRFRPNQGTEVILDMLKRFCQQGIWLDIGAGPATLFWGLMLSGIQELHCTEMYIEGLKVLDDFIESETIPQCYQDVMKMYKIAPEHLTLLRKTPRKYFLFDALQKWPSELNQQPYDIITAFGVFGLCKTPEEYQQSFSYMKAFLKPNGVAIGANWVRSQHFIDQNGGDNRYLDVHLVENAAHKYGYEIKHLSTEPIQGDPNYDGVLLWTLEN